MHTASKMIVIPRLIYELWQKNKYWIYILLTLTSIIVLSLVLTAIGYATTKDQGNNLRCNLCGDGFTWKTWLGDVYGNHCKNGSFGDKTVNCGSDSACFKMNNLISDKLKVVWKQSVEWHKNKSHHWSDHFVYYEGTIRGCIRGFGWLDKCHFYNSSQLSTWRSMEYWHASNLCVCTTDNCN